LALQGLEQAAVPINLLPPKESGLLGKLPNVFRKAPQSAWGLDLGTTSLKAVRLSYNRQQSAVTLEAIERVDYLQNPAEITDDFERRRLEKEAIRQFLERRKLDADRVCAGISGSYTLGRFLEVPSTDPKKLDDVIRREADFQFPMHLDELSWGHYVFPRAADSESQSLPYKVLMQAVKRYYVNQLLSVYRDAGLSLDVVQSDCVALHNLAEYELLSDADPEDTRPAVAMLEVGARSTNLVISSPRCVWFRTIGVAGEVFTNALLRPLKLTREQAEELKRSPARARRVYQVYDLLEPDAAHLVEEVERSLRTFRRQFRDVRVQQMYGIGGGFQLHGLLRRLCQL
jgi:type IV pilus assembly protein PilM